MNKKCSKCKLVSDVKMFNVCNTTKDKLRSWCRKCDKEFKKKYHQTEKYKLYTIEYRKKDSYKNQKKISDKKYNETHKKEKKEYDDKYRKIEKNIIRKKEVGKKYTNTDEYRKMNREVSRKRYKTDKYRKYMNNYITKRKLIDINFRLIYLLRSRIYHAIKNELKNGSAIKDLGCTIPLLKIHIEKQFKSGMNWNNHGKWHLDHKIPLSSFDLTNREQFLKACHYSNIQPLWAFDNLSKGSKVLSETHIENQP